MPISVFLKKIYFTFFKFMCMSVYLFVYVHTHTGAERVQKRVRAYGAGVISCERPDMGTGNQTGPLQEP